MGGRGGTCTHTLLLFNNCHLHKVHLAYLEVLIQMLIRDEETQPLTIARYTPEMTERLFLVVCMVVIVY